MTDEADHTGPAGDPDGWQRLWTPHRMEYVTRAEDVTEHDDPAAAGQCPFCRIPTSSDENGLVVARGQHVYAVLNLYPYNAGHVMVLPYRHVGDYCDASGDEVAEMASFTQQAMRTLRAVSAPHGFNIGINQGAAGGAGIAAHLHQHVVPRWNGDANFMPIIGRTKVLPQLLADTRSILAEAWDRS